MGKQTFKTSDGVDIAYIDDFTDLWKSAETLSCASATEQLAAFLFDGAGFRARRDRVDTRGHGASQIPPIIAGQQGTADEDAWSCSIT
jgi:hypothetical protein